MNTKPSDSHARLARSGFFGWLLALAMLASTACCSEEEYATGLLPEDQETYTATPLASRYRAFLPDEYDLSPYFPKPGYQGKQGSCVAWAAGYAARTYYQARTLGRKPDGPADQFSPAFIFNQVSAGDCTKGASISQVLSLLKRTGDISLADFPYDEGDCGRIPTENAVSSASRFRIEDWERVDIDRMDDIKGQIFSGHPVIIGMQISDSFKRLKEGIYDDTDSSFIHGNAMVIVGYSDPKQAFKLINSWGTRWGEDGFGWISYRAAQQRIQSAFVMKVNVPDWPPIPVKPSEEEVEVPAKRDEPPPKTPTTSAPSPSLESKLADLLDGAACANIGATVETGNKVVLRGFVGEREEIERIEAQLRQAGAEVSAEVEVRPWPQCEALLTLGDALANQGDLKVTLMDKESARLNVGERFHIEVTTPDYPSHLYLTYLQANGDAVILAQPKGRSPKPQAPHQQMIFGQGKDGKPKYTVVPPFGDEIIIAIAADKPLFGSSQSGVQLGREYLTQLRQVLSTESGAPARNVSAAIATLITVPKP